MHECIKHRQVYIYIYIYSFLYPGCPYTYQEFPGVSHPFGQNVTDGPNLDEAEECKYWCLVRSFCKGVDFDANTRTCYYLAQVEPPLVTRGVSGVTHYRKVDCTSER